MCGWIERFALDLKNVGEAETQLASPRQPPGRSTLHQRDFYQSNPEKLITSPSRMRRLCFLVRERSGVLKITR
jgi:hypothetical protein